MLIQDTFRWEIHRGSRPVESVAADEHHFAFGNLLKLISSYGENGEYDLLIDGVFTWNDTRSVQGNVGQIVDTLEPYKFDCSSVVLTAAKGILQDRNRARSYTVPPAEFDALYEGAYATVDASEFIVDTTHLTEAESMAQLRALPPVRSLLEGV